MRIADNFEDYDLTINSHIKNSRKKISAASPDKEIIGPTCEIGVCVQNLKLEDVERKRLRWVTQSPPNLELKMFIVRI